ncbi:hypothetical protein ACXO2V_07590 [Lactobacillus delbrueckii subsp. bulgaricus]
MSYGELTEVLRKVPTMGVYSDYSKLLREYKANYNKETSLTKQQAPAASAL